MRGRDSGDPESGGEVSVARLEGIGAGRTDAPVARFGAVLPDAPEHVPADLGGPAEPVEAGEPDAGAEAAAPVASFAAAADSPADAPGPAAGIAQFDGALFDAEQLAGSPDSAPVAELGGAGKRRRGVATGSTGRRAARPGERVSEAGDERPASSGRARAARRASPAAAPPEAVSPEADTRGVSADESDALDSGQSERQERSQQGRGRPRSRTGRSELAPGVDPVAAAREICLRLLTERARTRQELAQALSQRGVPDDAAGAVLERFDEVGLIDDAAFAGQWVRSRHNHRGLARRAIAYELRRKGVSDEDAGEALAEVDDDSEERRARELVDRKLRSVAVATVDERTAAVRRLVGMLARKGYGAGVAYRVVREALAARGAELDEELGVAELADD